MVAHYLKEIEELEEVAVIEKRFNSIEHFHRNVEVFILLEGEMQIHLNGKNIKLKSGSTVFFDSYDIHSYLNVPKSIKARALVVPYSIMSEYDTLKADKMVSEHVVHDRNFAFQLNSLVTQFILGKTTNTIKNYTVKLILSLILDKLKFKNTVEKDDTELIRKILIYVSEHFKEKLSLVSLSLKFGYAKEHISRVFHKYLSCSVPNYINGIRFNYVESQMKYGKKSLSELVFESGFGSLQTYYRFKAKVKKDN